MANYKLQKLDWYIIKKFLGTFFFTLSIFVAIAIVFDITEKLDNFIDREAPIKEIVFNYYLNFVPYWASVLSPLILFIAVIFFTARMADQTEIVAILSSGVSFKRLLYPYFVAAFFLAIITFVFNAYLIPNASKTRIEFENKYVRHKFVFKERNIHIQLDDETFIYMENYSNDQNVGYKFSIEKFRGGELYYKLMSNTISWDSVAASWKIKDYSIRYINPLSERMVNGTELDTVMDFSPKDFGRKDNIMETMTLSEINAYIKKVNVRGAESVDIYVIKKNEMFSVPFSTFILTLIGVSLSSKKVRGGIGMPLLVGITLCFTYIVLQKFSTTFATKGGLPPLLAVWTPNIIFGIIGLYLLKIAPK